MASASWDRKRAAHLYRRAGFGGRPEDLDRAISLGREGAVSYLVDYDGISTADLDAYLGLFGFDLEGYQEGIGDLRGTFITRWWYSRMLHGPRPLQEKMTLFWHNHFADLLRQGRGRAVDVRAEPDLSESRDGALRRPPARRLARPGDAHLARQREQRQGLPQRELRPRGHGALHDGPRQLHATGHHGIGQGLHRMDDRCGQSQSVHLRPERPRRGDQVLSRAAGLLQRRRHHRDSGRAPRDRRLHHPQARALLPRRRSRPPLSRKASRTSTSPAPATSARLSGRFSSPTSSIRPRMHPT